VTEVSGQIEAAPYEPSAGRLVYRNGYRIPAWDTWVGTIELEILKVTAGVCFPSPLELSSAIEPCMVETTAFAPLSSPSRPREGTGSNGK
jgi:transposase-like protein